MDCILIDIRLKTFFARHITRLSDSITGVKDEKEFLIRVAIGLAIVVAVVLLRNHIAKALLFIIAKLFGRRSDKNVSDIIDSLQKPVALLLSIISLNIAFKIVAPSGELNTVSSCLIKIGLIVSICWGALRYLNDELFFFSNINDDDSKSKQTVFKFIVNCSKILVVVIGALLILELFGFSASRVFAALGIGGVAVAFACKDAVENLISGFIIVFSKPFAVGDYISVGTLSGTVENIAVRSTTIRSLEGPEYIFPNTKLTTTEIVNWSRMEKRLVEESFCLNYRHKSADVEKFINSVEHILKSDDDVLDDDIRITFNEFSSNGSEIVVFFYLNKTNPREYALSKSRVNSKISELIEKNKFTLAYESRTVYVEQKANSKTEVEK